jgi:two-component system nitrate/nitrite response regulator NarL
MSRVFSMRRRSHLYARMSLRPAAQSNARQRAFRSTASFIAGASAVSDAGAVALRCLIVDDNEAFLGSASRLLESQGLQVVGRTSSGNEAVRLAQTLQPDVALVDVQLGDEDGLEVACRLSASARSTPVVLISTHSQEELAELIAESPAVGFLPKTALSAAAIAVLLG